VGGSRGRNAIAQSLATVDLITQAASSSTSATITEVAGTRKTIDTPPLSLNVSFVPQIPLTNGLSVVSDTASSRLSLPLDLSSPNSSGGGGSQAEDATPVSIPKSSLSTKPLPSATANPNPVVKPAKPADVPRADLRAPPAPPTPAEAPRVKEIQSTSQYDWTGLDALKEDTVGTSGPHVVDAVFITSAIASAGYLLLTSRSVFWLLSALTARPLWKQLDPLEVLFAWEKDKEKMRGWKPGADEEETLRSLVESECPSTC